jgi:sulfite reductase (ferredoxin)
VYQFLNGAGKKIATEVLTNYSYVPLYLENRDFYIDWGRTEEFSLSGLGPGECGAGVLDMIESDLTDAKLALEKAESEGWLPEEIKKALFFSARALLIVKGRDPKNENEAFSDFKEKFIDEGMASSLYSDIKDIFDSINDRLDPEERKDKFLYAKGFLKHIDELYKGMDASFNFPKQILKQKADILKEQDKTDKILDLKGTPCPLNYVKAKLFLENLNSGSTVEIFLDEGEPIENVPKSLQNDGHQIIKIERSNGFYRLLVKKK